MARGVNQQHHKDPGLAGQRNQFCCSSCFFVRITKCGAAIHEHLMSTGEDLVCEKTCAVVSSRSHSVILCVATDETCPAA